MAEDINNQSENAVVDADSPDSDKPFDISTQEFYEISRRLEKYHAIFYRMWEMGKPYFTKRLPTAAVQFNKEGNHTNWMWNPDFWKDCNEYKRDFVFCHEMLHIALNHGVRIKDAKYRRLTNMTLDVVVNHLLIDKFGFKREKIKGEEDLCWIDTVFAGKEDQVEKGKHFEYYYNRFLQLFPPPPESKGIPLAGEGDGDGLPDTIDDHDGLSGKEWETIVKDIDSILSNDEKEEIREIVEKHFQVADPSEEDKDNKKPKYAGTGIGGVWTFVDVSRVKPKSKWETVIKNWCRTKIKESNRTVEQWARLNRRFSLLPQELMIPSEMEQESLGEEEHKIRVVFALDTSGSCIGLKDRFIKAATSLPRDKFDVVGVCFDTEVYPVDIWKGEIKGGGGTSFRIIEEFIQKAMEKDWYDNVRDDRGQIVNDSTGKPRQRLVWKKGEYPDAVFLITDGFGDSVSPEHPDRWHWFLSEDYRSCIPKQSKVFMLREYE